MKKGILYQQQIYPKSLSQESLLYADDKYSKMYRKIRLCILKYNYIGICKDGSPIMVLWDHGNKCVTPLNLLRNDFMYYCYLDKLGLEDRRPEHCYVVAKMIVDNDLELYEIYAS